MGSKRSRRRESRQPAVRHGSPAAKLLPGAIAGIAALVAFAVFSSSDSQQRQAHTPVAAPARAPRTAQAPAPRPTAPSRGPLATRSSADLPPLPLVAFPAPRPPEIIRAVYEFAAYHPEVLDYVPCFCGCEQFGHRANHDCFVAHHDGDGHITWDAHAMGWAICVDVARDAARMHEAGLPLADIRTSIDRSYGPHYMTRTPTPPVP